MDTVTDRRQLMCLAYSHCSPRDVRDALDTHEQAVLAAHPGAINFAVTADGQGCLWLSFVRPMTGDELARRDQELERAGREEQNLYLRLRHKFEAKADHPWHTAGRN
jgi:hypothetical protein